jgi:signal recognition particle GTPase
MAAKKRATERQEGNFPRKRAASKKERKPARSKNTASQSRRTGAGRATNAGTYYQNRMSAWWGAVILAEADAQPPFDLPANLTFESLFAETNTAVDDLTVHTSANGSIACQAKHKLALETIPTSDIGKTVSQFVRHFRAGNPKLDPTKDRLVLVTTSLSSAPIRIRLRAFLDRLRTSASPQKEWTAGNKEENHAAAAIRSHVVKAWRAECGKSPTAAEIIELLRLVHVQTLDVDLGGDHEREAKQLLRRSVLTKPSDANKAWNTLLAEVGQYATTGQSADRPALQRAFARDGIAFKAPRSFQHDISRLKDLTNATLKTLLEYARIQAAGRTIAIQRPVAKELEAGAADGHTLVLGLPGAGKSGALYELARALQKTNDVVLLAVDQIDAASLGTLRTELGLEHDLLTVLDAWPGSGPGYVVVDALDAARSEGAIKTLQALLRAVITSKGRWHAVASVRKFDLRYNAPLRSLFQGSPPSPDYIDPEFFSVRHLNVPVLTPGELSQVQAQSPQLGELVSGASPRLQEVLYLPFNLRLLAELLDAGLTPAELQPVRTQIELLDRYWQERIRRNDGEGDARELVLERVTAAMIARRSLRVTRKAAMEKEAASGPYLDALLRAHVLAEWTTQSGAPRPEFITFQHHLLFDYAGARLCVPPEPDDLADLLSKQPDLLIAIRPSLELYCQRLWHHDQPSFWELTFRLSGSNVNEVGKLLGPAVAALYATEYSETTALLDGLKNPAQNAAALAVLHHILATLLTHRTVDTIWIEFLDAATTDLTGSLAHNVRPYIFFLSDQTGQLNPDNLNRLGRISRRLLAFGLLDPEKHAWLITGGIIAAAKTVMTDPAGTITIFRGCITPEHLKAHGYRTLPTVTRQVEFLMGADPGFVGDLYTAGFAYHDESGEKTSMNDSQIFAMSSNRKQDYEMGLYLLAEYFPRFLEQAPQLAVDSLLKIAVGWVAAEHPTSDQPVPVRLDDIETRLVPDYSSIWGHGPGSHHDEPFQMLRSFQTYIETLTDETPIRAIVEAVAAAQPPALLWRALLSAGIQKPTTVVA